jgi:hypothetical protein
MKVLNNLAIRENKLTRKTSKSEVKGATKARIIANFLVANILILALGISFTIK